QCILGIGFQCSPDQKFGVVGFGSCKTLPASIQQPLQIGGRGVGNDQQGFAHSGTGASAWARAQESRRPAIFSARLVSIMGTRAPTSKPAAWALPRYISCLARMLPDSRSGASRISASPATGEAMP